MTQEEAIARLMSVAVGGRRHQHYQRTRDYATLCLQLSTGEGVDLLLRQFARRESEEAFTQRKKLTQHVVQAVVSNILSVFEKVPRAPYQRVLHYTDDQETGQKSKDLTKALGKFWGEESADEWVKTRLLELNATDPNTFVVLEFQPFDANKERAQPYPFEVPSAAAVDFGWINNSLTYLIAHTVLPTRKMGSKEFTPNRFTAYLPDFTLVLDELSEVDVRGLKLRDGVWTETTMGLIYRAKDKYWLLSTPTPHNAGRVPAFRVGYKRDKATAGKTFVSPYHEAIQFLLKSIKAVSENDLVRALIAFPLRLRYALPCDAPGCIDGRTMNGQTACTTCSGTGFKPSPSSSQEEMLLPMPKVKEDIIDLSSLTAFVAPDVAVVKEQTDYIDYLCAQAKKTVFNSDIFTRNEVADTATGKRIDVENSQDALSPFARKFGRTWEFIVDIVAEFTDLKKGLVRGMVFGSDLKLKNLNELLQDLESVNRSEAGPNARRAVMEDVARVLYRDNPDEFKRVRTRSMFDPFNGYSETERMFLLSSDLTDRRSKVLAANLGRVFDEIEQEQAALPQPVNFYDLAYPKQKELVDAKVTSMIAELTGSRPVLQLDPTLTA